MIARDALGEAWSEGVAPQPVPAAAPRWWGEQAPNFDLEDAPYPALRVLDLPGGSVLGPQGWAFTSENALVPECSWYGADFPAGQYPLAFARERRLKGTCLSIASEFARDNYGHFMLDCVPRLGIALAAGVDLASIDHFYLPRPPSRSAERVLAAAGVDPARCVWAVGRERIRADRLLVTSFPGRRRDYPSSTPAFLRALFPGKSAPSRRIFIRRPGSRRVTNEDALVEIAAGHGFTCYDHRDIADEPRFFAETAIVVGAHGSGLTNIAFCRPGAKLLELIPSDHIHPYYFTLARAGGLEYHGIVGRSAGHRTKGAWGPSPFDFTIDPAVFAAALAEMLR